MKFFNGMFSAFTRDNETAIQRFYRIEYSKDYRELKKAGVVLNDKTISNIIGRRWKMLILAILLCVCYYITNKKENIVPWHKWRFMPGEYFLAGAYLAIWIFNIAINTTFLGTQMSMAFLLYSALINDIWFYIILHDRCVINKVVD